MGKLIFIGVDPGEVTGVSFLDLDGKYFSVELPHQQAMTHVRDIIAVAGDVGVRLGVEQYVQRRNSRLTEQPAAQRVTGAVQALGYFTRLIAPSTAKVMCTDHRLKQLGWYKKTPDGHCNDSGRVLFALIAITSPLMVNSLLPLG
jgi:hypothetical protein